MTTQAPLESAATGPVECLGRTFASDDERREHYLRLLADKLKDAEFRSTPGFPKGSDEAILRMSDPPYYTACPNPFLEEFVRFHRRPWDPGEDYSRKPFAVDVSVGKTDPLYRAHGYHTKVPHLAIVPSILQGRRSAQAARARPLVRSRRISLRRCDATTAGTTGPWRRSSRTAARSSLF